MPADAGAGQLRPWLFVRTFERGVEAETQVRHVALSACTPKPMRRIAVHNIARHAAQVLLLVPSSQPQ